MCDHLCAEDLRDAGQELDGHLLPLGAVHLGSKPSQLFQEVIAKAATGQRGEKEITKGKHFYPNPEVRTNGGKCGVTPILKKERLSNQNISKIKKKISYLFLSLTSFLYSQLLVSFKLVRVLHFYHSEKRCFKNGTIVF